jgi:uncharacterized protein (DUF1330 family)
MSTYVIMDIKVTDPLGYEHYKQLAPPTVNQYGGKYLARGGPVESLEGNWQSQRLVILEFDNHEKAKAWLDSPEYAPAKAMRHRYASTRMILVDGI